jgi:plastocyanin
MRALGWKSIKVVVALPVLTLLAISCWAGEGNAGGKPRAHTVAIRAFQYVPADLTVATGDTVVWINEDLVPHTATAEGKTFDSGSIAVKQSWQYVARDKGQFEYVCTFHSNMKATLTVR